MTLESTMINSRRQDAERGKLGAPNVHELYHQILPEPKMSRSRRVANVQEQLAVALGRGEGAGGDVAHEVSSVVQPQETCQQRVGRGEGGRGEAPLPNPKATQPEAHPLLIKISFSGHCGDFFARPTR